MKESYRDKISHFKRLIRKIRLLKEEDKNEKTSHKEINCNK